MSRPMPHGTCATCCSAGTAHAPTDATCCLAESAVAEHACFSHLLFNSITYRGACHTACVTCCSAVTAHAPADATCCSAQSAVAEHALSHATCCSAFTEHVTQTPFCLRHVLLSCRYACASSTTLLVDSGLKAQAYFLSFGHRVLHC